VKVVFLCGGVGKRMFPITEDKFLLDFLGNTLFEKQVLLAQSAGLNDFVIIANKGNADRLKQLADGIKKGAKFSFAIQEQPLGIANALMSASHLLKDEIIVVNPNDVFGISAYQEMLSAYKKGNAASYILGYQINGYFPGGYLSVDENNHLKHIIEKPAPGTEPGNLINILLHLHTDVKLLLKHIASVHTTHDDVYECALDSIVQTGIKIRVVPYKGIWAPIKYPWHILDIVKIMLDAANTKISSSATISDHAVIEGKVVIGDHVRILENAVIRGPVYIGSGTIIGNNALVREYSHIGNNCVVGFSSEIKGSYIGNNCWFHSNYIGDSIIGNHCSFGAGSVTANFRFDENNIQVSYDEGTLSTGRDHFGAIIGDYCKMGINSGILPGRRIGPNSIVGAHVCLASNLGPGMMAIQRHEYQLLKHSTDSGDVKSQ
jgi:bifunctional UDP-N-acetylglucosamine pyrophosphorylase/glucosamine-1-phosphate N-acetyltransferase